MKYIGIIKLAMLSLLLVSYPVLAAETDQMMGMSPAVFVLTMFLVCTFIGIVAVLAGVGGGVIFTPLLMGFTPIDSYVIRATGLTVAMAGALVAGRPFLRRGLANIRLLFLSAVPYTVSAVIGALLAGYIKATMGEFGEGIIRICLGALVFFYSSSIHICWKENRISRGKAC